ncbi:MAG TPA: FAD-binding protein [Ramlibacter sp.]|uniref:FAD-binding protein n=1 Tax=Ramlibacter sp. TaxID=1917967 RepID=UPI002D18854E|nr:FAD-binding protein [Ramlibacter sp.]HVZ45248.1 FAD-binding protein [Ramlibacter sp.]
MRDPSDRQIDEVDLLVFGAGAGGMSAALAAAIMGLEVLVCEKSSQVGGTAATSAGTIWIPENRQSREAGFHDTREAARRYFRELLPDGDDGQALREAYLQDGPDVVDWFEANSEVRFVPSGMHPDYQDLDGSAPSGRAMSPLEFDARVMGPAFSHVRAPIPEFLVFGGMMVGKADIPRLVGRFESAGNFLHAAKLFLRFVADRLRYPRGTRLVMGNAFVARLYHSLRLRHVPVLLETKLEEVVIEAGRATGAIVSCGGRRRMVRARKGIVLATGGFAHNEALRKEFMPAPTPMDSMAVPANQGDGIAAATRIGASTKPAHHGTGAFWSPVSRTGSGEWAGLFPHLSLDRAKPGLLAVNAAGKRFVNEAVSYHHFVEAMFESHKTTPTIPAWLICESSFVRKYGLGNIRPGTTRLAPFERDGEFVCALTLDELAHKTGVDTAGLKATVARHNGFAATGVDLDFAKGTTQLNRFNGDPAHGPNPCIGPLGNGPYCAMAVWPAEIGCSTGLETDEHARVLDAGQQPIPGLYACGNDLASIMRGTYPGPGTTLGPALVFGYRAALHARGAGAAPGSQTTSGVTAPSIETIAPEM